MFDTNKAVTDTANHAARGAGDVAVLLCPSDPSSATVAETAGSPAGVAGRTNYFANLGLHSNTSEGSGSATKPGQFAGVFSHGRQTRFTEIIDGMTNTSLFAEIRRGAGAAGRFSVTQVSLGSWPVVPPATAFSTIARYTDLPADAALSAVCDAAAATNNSAGLEFHAGTAINTFYTHTVPPNHSGRDCISFPTTSNIHLAARSAHTGGVNVCLGDGSVRFVRDGIDRAGWRALGSRAGGEVGAGID